MCNSDKKHKIKLNQIATDVMGQLQHKKETNCNHVSGHNCNHVKRMHDYKLAPAVEGKKTNPIQYLVVASTDSIISFSFLNKHAALLKIFPPLFCTS
jgi:hypothetical protein